MQDPLDEECWPGWATWSFGAKLVPRVAPAPQGALADCEGLFLAGGVQLHRYRIALDQGTNVFVLGLGSLAKPHAAPGRGEAATEDGIASLNVNHTMPRMPAP